MTICDTVQRQLAEAGVEAAAIEDIAHHLEGCDDCSKFLADLQTIDAGLIELTSHDAPDALVAETLAAVRAAEPPKPMPVRPPQRQRWLARGLAGGAVIAASVALTLTVFDPSQFSDVVATRITAAEEVSSDDNGGFFERSYGLQSQKAAAPTARDAEQVLSESETSSASGPVGGVLQRRAQDAPDVGDFRAREDFFRYFADGRLSVDQSAQAKAPESEEAGAAARRELDVIAQVAPQELAHRHAGRAELERQAGEAGNREQFEERSESVRGDAPNAPPATGSIPETVGNKAKSDDDGRLGAESGRVRVTIPNAEPPRSAVVEGQSSSDLSELNKEAPEKSSRTEEGFKQQERLNSVLGAGEATKGAATNEVTRGVPAEQPVASPKPVEAGKDEKKNRDSVANARDGFDKDTGQADG
ncbi:MAG: hypothetical protein OER92_10900, partial [Alphaproteobacteria bacterium]|nr:hypothetical protein [Alphaproteobacteria bacterium]